MTSHPTRAAPVPPSGGAERELLEAFEREGPAVLAYLRAAAGDDAEDLAARTFLRAWRGWTAYRATDRPARHWLLRIARCLALERAREREDGVVLPLRRPDTGGPDPILAALETVTPDEREALAMRSAGLTFAEIGTHLGRTEAGARLAWHRAARRVRSHLEG